MSSKLRTKSGCVSCKFRRKKCDETKPSCKACSRLGFHCSYGPGNDSRNSNSTNFKFDFAQRDQIIDWVEKAWSMQTKEAISVPMSLSLEAFQLSICEAFLVNVIEQQFCNQYGDSRKEMNHSVTECDQFGALTIHVLPSFGPTTDNPSLRLAWQAYCQFMFGKEYRLSETLRQARIKYGKSLHALYELTWKRHDANVACEMISIVILLYLFESEVRTDPAAFTNHIMGVLQMIVRLGPHAFADPRRIRLLENVRTAIAFSCFLSRRPCVLSDEQWLSIPWLFTDEFGQHHRKRVEQQVLDLFMISAKAKLEIDKIATCDRETANEIARRFWNDYGDIRHQLLDWQMRNWEELHVTGWRVFEGSENADVFPFGVPCFLHPIIISARVWHLNVLMSLHDIVSVLCVLMAENALDHDPSAQTAMVKWLWRQEPGYKDHLMTLAASNEIDARQNENGSNEGIRTLWLAMADRSASLNHEAAASACNEIAAFLADRKGRPHQMALNVLLPFKDLLDDCKERDWVRSTLLSFSMAQTYQSLIPTS